MTFHGFFELLPAVDIYEGNCVRLKQGDYKQITIYNNDPVATAKRWESEGATRLHVVDLEGARDGIFRNVEIIQKICRSVAIPVQAGGGIRSREALDQLFAAGVARAVLGTRALNDFDFLKGALDAYGNKLLVSLDARASELATEGWVKSGGGADLFETAKALEKAGVARIAYTDISKDGMMAGPNVEGLRAVAQTIRIPLIASGGVSTPEDIQNVRAIEGIEGCIIGRALYEGTIQLKDFFSPRPS